MSIAAIPTVYNGIQFRSRLEARWAAFFDLCGWSWAYEPMDLSGWFPDFAIYPMTWVDGRGTHASQRDRPILVEVKPISDFDRAVANKMQRATAGMADRPVQISGLLMLGLSPFAGRSKWFRSLGWYIHHFELRLGLGSDRPWTTPSLVLLRGAYTRDDGVQIEKLVTFESMSPRDGIIEQDLPLCMIDEGSAEYVDSLWVHASNLVQWKGRQNRG